MNTEIVAINRTIGVAVVKQIGTGKPWYELSIVDHNARITAVDSFYGNEADAMKAYEDYKKSK